MSQPLPVACGDTCLCLVFSHAAFKGAVRCRFELQRFFLVQRPTGIFFPRMEQTNKQKPRPLRPPCGDNAETQVPLNMAVCYVCSRNVMESTSKWYCP